MLTRLLSCWGVPGAGGQGGGQDAGLETELGKLKAMNSLPSFSRPSASLGQVPPCSSAGPGSQLSTEGTGQEAAAGLQLGAELGPRRLE